MRLRAEALEVSYGGRPVLRGVDLAVPSGTFAAVIGPNGAGKSSLLRALQGWQPCRGQVRLDETNLHAMRQGERARHVGYLPQDNAVRSSLTVLDVVVLGQIEGLAWRVSRETMESAIDALGRLQLLHLAAAPIGTLSGGQRQLVFLAQALAKKPGLILLDEPTSALDLRHQLMVLDLLHAIAAEGGPAILAVMHDLNLAARFADQIIVLQDGRIHSAGKPADVLTARMLAEVFEVEAEVLVSSQQRPLIMPLRASAQTTHDDRHGAATLPPLHPIAQVLDKENPMMAMFRRTFMLAAGSLLLSPRIAKAQAAASGPALDLGAPLRAPFSVPPLLYAYEANEPAIDRQTMQLHHDKHHAAYVNNLNAALKDHPDVAALPLHEILLQVQTLPDTIRIALRNNAGGHANHTMFWQIMGGTGGEPSGEVATAISHDFGSFAKLQSDFNQAAARVFGSGWAMVLVDREGKLSLVARPNQDSPIMEGHFVLFGNDVWEHAYYLKYQNRRADYLTSWWTILNWSRIGERYAAAKAGMLRI